MYSHSVAARYRVAVKSLVVGHTAVAAAAAPVEVFAVVVDSEVVVADLGLDT